MRFCEFLLNFGKFLIQFFECLLEYFELLLVNFCENELLIYAFSDSFMFLPRP